LGVSVMVLPFFARFCLVFHRRNIKNAPRVLAEGGKRRCDRSLRGDLRSKEFGGGGRFLVGMKLAGNAPFLRKRQSTGRPRALDDEYSLSHPSGISPFTVFDNLFSFQFSSELLQPTKRTQHR